MKNTQTLNVSFDFNLKTCFFFFSSAFIYLEAESVKHAAFIRAVF